MELEINIMFNKWIDTGGFHNVRKTALHSSMIRDTLKPINYRGKIKLHGTNAGVTITDEGDVIVQSRKNIITPEQDNAGFAMFVERNKEAFTAMTALSDFTIFGEWCGGSIQKGVAISDIGKKVFAVFAIMEGHFEDDDCFILTEPDLIKGIVGDDVEDLHVLPWYGDAFEVRFQEPDELRKTVDKLNEDIDAVEEEDPWVKEVFDVSGIGEGIVYYPFWNDLFVTRNLFSCLAFKAKGDKHSVNKQKRPVQIDPEVSNSITEFVDNVVTPGRLEQAFVDGVGRELDSKKIGPFIGWVSKDIAKECMDELAASGLEWKQVTGTIATRARKWYMVKLSETF